MYAAGCLGGREAGVYGTGGDRAACCARATCRCTRAVRLNGARGMVQSDRSYVTFVRWCVACRLRTHVVTLCERVAVPRMFRRRGRRVSRAQQLVYFIGDRL